MSLRKQSLKKQLKDFRVHFESEIDAYETYYIKRIQKEKLNLIKKIAKDYKLSRKEMEKKYLNLSKHDIQALDDMSDVSDDKEPVYKLVVIKGKNCFHDEENNVYYNENNEEISGKTGRVLKIKKNSKKVTK